MKFSSALFAASAAALTVTLSACEGLKEAMSAHVGTVARAGNQELSVDKLVTYMTEAKMPPRKEVANVIANTWLDYQLLAQSAAKGDTTISNAAIDSAAWAQLASFKARRYFELVSKSWTSPADEATARKMYDNGEVLAASHILLLARKDTTAAVKAAAKAKATALRVQVNSGNFADVATKNSQDPGSGKQGGKLGIFRKGTMVPQFEKALLALKPGEISQVIETDYGYHIIRRATFDEVKDQVLPLANQHGRQVGESTFVANLTKNGKIDVKSDAPAAARAILNDPDSHLKDGSTLATSTAGNFTAGRFAQWLLSLPPQQFQQQRAGLLAQPDSVIQGVIKQFTLNELVLKAADSAKVGPTPDEINQLHDGFRTARNAVWTQLNIDPKSLAEAGKTPEEREKVAAARVDTYMEQLVLGKARYTEVPPTLARILRDGAGGAAVNGTGIDRALEQASKARVAADSTKRAAEPPTAVPMGQPGTGVAPQGTAPGGATPPAPSGATPNPAAAPQPAQH
jgi:hypothetical protein